MLYFQLPLKLIKVLIRDLMSTQNWTQPVQEKNQHDAIFLNSWYSFAHLLVEEILLNKYRLYLVPQLNKVEILPNQK